MATAKKKSIKKIPWEMSVKESDPIVGLKLNQFHSVGSFLGEGAFGKVYTVRNSRDLNEKVWAVKVVSFAATTANGSQKKKNAASTPADRLHYEHLMYTQQLRHLCGTILPNLPSNHLHQLSSFYPTIRNEKNNSEYRCLVLERMQCELLDILPSFVDQCRVSVTEIALGPVCTQLIHIVEAVHKSWHILVDVKPDNLMIDCKFALSTTVKSKATISTEDLSKSIRLVDFGLLKSMVGTTGTHMENIPTSEVQGTPLYSSLHVHNLQAPSRRDDVYAMLYVIGDIVLHVHGLLSNKSKPYGTGTKSASYFPWSQETNDAAIGKIKTEQMKSIKSNYFASMPNKSIAEILYTAHQQMQDTNFAQIPNYESVRTLLSNIKIPVPVSSATTSASANSTTASKKRTGNDQSTLPVVRGADKISVQLRRSTRHDSKENVVAIDMTTRPSKIMKQSDSEFIEHIASDSDDVTMYDAEQGDMNDDSDIEMVDIATDIKEDCKPAAATSNKCKGLQFTIEGGLGKTTSQTIVLTASEPTLVISSSSTFAGHKLSFPDWNGSLRLTLSPKIPNAIQVEPIGKRSEVKVNNLVVPSSGTVAFFRQSIVFGPYTVRNMQPWKKSQEVPKENISSMNATIDSNTGIRRGVKRHDVVKTTPPQPFIPVPTNPFLVLKVTSPESLKGMTYVLEQGVSDTLSIGSDASCNKNKSGWIVFDPIEYQIELKHACVSLVVQRGTRMVQVQDLTSTAGTYVSNKRIPTGKKQMAFCNQSIRTGNIEFVVTNQV